MKLLPFVFLTVCVFISTTHGSINGYITPGDRNRLLEAFTKGFVKLQEGDVVTVYQAAKGFELLGQKVVKVLFMDACAHLKDNFKEDSTPEAAFHAISTWTILKCEGKLYSDVHLNVLKVALGSDKSSTSDLRYAAETLHVLNIPIPNPEKVGKLLQAKLKEDDGLQSLGHALHLSSLLGNAGKFILDRIEDVVVQADEVDGKMLQWEGGLTITGLLLTGLFRVPGAKPLTEAQADKFAVYLLSRRSVQTPRGALALIQSAQVLASSSVSPVSLTISGPPHVTSDKPDLTIKLTNLLGEPLKTLPSPVVAQSAIRITDDVVVLSKQPLTPGKDSKTEFILPLRLEPGQYKLALSAGQHTSTFTVRVLGPITLKNLEVGLGDADGASAPKLYKLNYNSQLDQVLQADSTHNLIMKFNLPRPVHQAFLRLSAGKREIIFIAERDTSQSYKMSVNLASELTSSGKFEMELIIGDAIVSNPFRWKLGYVQVSVSQSGESEEKIQLTGPKPEIEHLFRQPEKRPPQTVSLLFTALAGAPLLLLFVLWGRIGVNISNFSFTAIPFHIGFAAILGLFALFWLRLDMFVTCGWLLPIGGFTFLSGNVLLNKIAKQRK
ncbi:dolichyl-diphosphooligosaccharide--protein glycosyltransferase subunit 2 [Onthophagus taurus]|uniref:dolichyl-diphosphooligosaccharide--protein glycosyltransferase subunit 2 n=1 Tax=Onthophagus taurus TaxID=166361 RepID=UPI0039BDCDFF